ncbi:MAG: hypothetical protein U9N52_07570 [Campylobacterota bacterium]|nr:hypothetical protein [Campylobacterota bacterium]
MTVDVNVTKIDEAMLEDIDEIMEDTMIQMFITHPKTAEAIEEIQEIAEEYTSIFYSVPVALAEMADANCVAYSLTCKEEFTKCDKPLFVDEADLNEALISTLTIKECQGIIINATKPHDELSNFFISIGPDTIESFDATLLNKVSMNQLVLQSHYPNHGFETIFETVKKISDAMYRPDQSIIAEATKNTLVLLGFKKS